jgi:uncharacterized protein with PQ loop repeat
MTLASLVGPVAAASGVLMALSPLLQARRVRIAGDSSEVSAGVFLMMRTNASLWLLYGIGTANAVIVVPNLVALGTTTVTLLALRRYRRPPKAAPVASPERGHVARVRLGAATLARAGRELRFARR